MTAVIFNQNNFVMLTIAGSTTLAIYLATNVVGFGIVAGVLALIALFFAFQGQEKKTLHLSDAVRNEQNLKPKGGWQTMSNLQIAQFVKQEVATINKFLAARGIEEYIDDDVLEWEYGSLAYLIMRDASTKSETLSKLCEEIDARINTFRFKNKFPKASTRFQTLTDGTFAFVVAHPMPKEIRWHHGQVIEGGPLTAVIGKQEEFLQGDDDVKLHLPTFPTTLIAGRTGSGKSSALKHMLGSLLFNNSHLDLSVCLVDIKQDDLQEFVKCPHVIASVSEAEGIDRLLTYLENEAVRRKGLSDKGPAILTVIDELVDFSAQKLPGTKRGEPSFIDRLGRLMSKGRGLGLYFWLGSQATTKDAGVEALIKNNITAKLVGQFGADVAHIATGMDRDSAPVHLLTQKGAFYLLDGDIRRVQSVFVHENDMSAFIKMITNKFYEDDGLLITDEEDDSTPAQMHQLKKTPVANNQSEIDALKEQVKILTELLAAKQSNDGGITGAIGQGPELPKLPQNVSAEQSSVPECEEDWIKILQADAKLHHLPAKEIALKFCSSSSSSIQAKINRAKDKLGIQRQTRGRK